jgi:predicted transcriptional regulator of viral defense system
MTNPSDNKIKEAVQLFEKNSGVLRTSQATSAGVQPRTLYWMRDNGVIDRLSRGVFHLRSFPLPSNPDATAVMKRIPKAVLCLVSALEYFEIGTQIPSAVHIALPKGMKTPKVDSPRIKVFRMGYTSLTEGVEYINVSGTDIAVFNPAKTVADCFKFRNRIGLDIAVEALQEVIKKGKASPSEIMRYAKVNRVDSVIRPYLVALL